MQVGVDSIWLTHFCERQAPAGFGDAHGESDDEGSEGVDEDVEDGMELSDADDDDDDDDEYDGDEEEYDEEAEEEEESDVPMPAPRGGRPQKEKPSDDSKSEVSDARGNDDDDEDLDLLTGPLLPTIASSSKAAPSAAAASSSQMSAPLPNVIIPMGESAEDAQNLPQQVSSSSSSSDDGVVTPAGIKVSANAAASAAASGEVRILSLNMENLAVHDAVYGNKEMPLFDHGKLFFVVVCLLVLFDPSFTSIGQALILIALLFCRSQICSPIN